MSLLAKLTSNLKIGIRIYAGFVVVLLLLLTLATWVHILASAA